MSTVLWANVLIDGVVQSEQEDRDALSAHADKLDDLCKALGIPSFSAICDTTDVQFNLDDDAELPEGMTSTNELMAKDGAWMDLAEAIGMLEALLQHIQDKSVRFGFLSNQHSEVVAELRAVLAFAKAHSEKSAKFNFSIVM